MAQRSSYRLRPRLVAGASLTVVEHTYTMPVFGHIHQVEEDADGAQKRCRALLVETMQQRLQLAFSIGRPLSAQTRQGQDLFDEFRRRRAQLLLQNLHEIRRQPAHLLGQHHLRGHRLPFTLCRSVPGRGSRGRRSRREWHRCR